MTPPRPPARPTLAWILGLLLAAGTLVVPTARGATARPNLLFILTDDQRFDTLGCAGNPLIQTPNIDRLAARGVRFRNHFVTCPICCVSRATLFTGQYPGRHGIGDFSTPFRRDQWESSYPARLRAAGYRTGFIGKFGVGDPASIRAHASDFDFWRGLPGQAGESFFDPADPAHRHATARFGDEALEFLTEGDTARPFCLSISFNAPHARDGRPREFEPDPRDEPLYAATRIALPATATDTAFKQLPGFVQTSEARRRWQRRFATPELQQQTLRDYYRLITGVDREVGRIVAALEQQHRLGNTVIVFTSDNGWFAGERGLADKWFLYEESIRVPLVIADPRMPARHRGTTVDAMTLNVDLAPTLLELAGIAAPSGMQGRSLRPWLEGRRPFRWRQEFLMEHRYGPSLIPPSEGIRTERWAYFRWLSPNPSSEELYDLPADPREERNLAAEGAQSRVLRDLRRRLERQLSESR